MTPEKFEEHISSDEFIQVVARNLLIEKTPYAHVTSEEMKLGYNLIVAHHSVTFTLYFPKKGRDMTLCVRYFGADEGQRWTVMGGIVHLFQLSGKVNIPSTPHLVYSLCGGIEYTTNIPKNLSDFSEVQRLLTTAHQCATTYSATDLPLQICEQLIHPRGIFKTKEDLIEAVLTQDPEEAFSLYYFLGALVKSCKESTEWNILVDPLEKAISKLEKSSNDLLNTFGDLISTLIKS